MYCESGYHVQRNYILLLCVVMKPKIKHSTLLYCIIWQNYIIVYYNEFLITALLCHTFIVLQCILLLLFYLFNNTKSKYFN